MHKRSGGVALEQIGGGVRLSEKQEARDAVCIECPASVAVYQWSAFRRVGWGLSCD